jgi:hypothetical protein
MAISRQQAHPRACLVRTFMSTGLKAGADEQTFGGSVVGAILNRNLIDWEYPKRCTDECHHGFAADAASISVWRQHQSDLARVSVAVDALNAAQTDRAPAGLFYDPAERVSKRPLRVAT